MDGMEVDNMNILIEQFVDNEATDEVQDAAFTG